MGQHHSAPTYIPLNLQPEMAAGPPQAKRPRYFGPAADPEQPGTSGIWSSDTPILIEDEDELEDLFDQELYYSSPSSAKITEEVRAFLGSTFCRSIPKHKRQEIAREYSKPDLPAAKVPKIDSDILGVLGGEFHHPQLYMNMCDVTCLLVILSPFDWYRVQTPEIPSLSQSPPTFFELMEPQPLAHCLHDLEVVWHSG